MQGGTSMEMKADDKDVLLDHEKMQRESDDGMVDLTAAMVLQIAAGHSDAWYNPTAKSRKEASPLLYERVKTACIEKLGMKENVNTSPLSKLVLVNVPQDFHHRNEKEGLVEIKMEIIEKNIETKKILNTWTIMVDADPENPSSQNPQPPHFGFQVGLHKTGSSATKFTGHIWLPKSDPPPYVRPGHKITSFSGTQRKGTDTSSIFFYMSGQRFYVNTV